MSLVTFECPPQGLPHEVAGTSSFLVIADNRRKGIVLEVMNRSFFLYLISTALISGCTDLSKTQAPATAAAPTPTPENYGLYTDSDLQIYADTVDLRIQEALKNNNTSQAQELGRKRQELIAEFNRRGLKRKPTEPTRHSHHPHTVNLPRGGLPGED